MRLSLMVAMDGRRLIGRDRGLPWRLPADLRRFKTLTMGKPLIMGRRTHESIGRALPGRLNIVLSRDASFRTPGCVTASTAEEALRAAEPAEEVVVIGGAAVYAEFLPRADRIYLTEVAGDFEGDTHFPDLDFSVWRETCRETHPADDANPHTHVFRILDR